MDFRSVNPSSRSSSDNGNSDSNSSSSNSDGSSSSSGDSSSDSFPSGTSSSDSFPSGTSSSDSFPSGTSSSDSSGICIAPMMASRGVTPTAVAMTLAVAIVAAVVSPLPFLPGTHAAKVKASQWSVMQVLKREWGAFSGSETWSSSADCANMVGVACTSHGDIIAMDLSFKGLKGSIPASIGTLPEIQFLILARNRLTGPLPPNFVNPAVLNQLDLGDNQLSGSIPANFSRLGGLMELRLNNNQLSGTITEDVMPAWSNLRVLLLNNNQFSGSLPANMSRLQLLTELDVSSNQLSENLLPDINTLTALAYLSVSNNLMRLSIPSLSTLTNLYYLDLSKNQFSSLFPLGLDKLKKLQYLYLNDNAIFGSASPLMTSMSNLLELSIANTRVSGDVNTFLATFTTLTVLDIRESSLSGALSAGISDLTRLKELRMGGVIFDDVLPQEIASLSGLSLLDLSNTKTHGPLPDPLDTMISLRHLNLSGNVIGGFIDPISTLTTLTYLGLSDVTFFTTPSNDFSRLRNLEALDLSNNPFHAPIPQFLLDFPLLKSLKLTNSAFFGSIPVPTDLNTAFTHLDLSGNLFMGSLPDGISNVAGAVTIDISGNDIEGSIPASFTTLRKLQNLVLASNQLSGDIAPILSQLTDLRKLDLSFNQISGPLPTALSLATALSHLDLSNNIFSGSLPLGYSRLSQLSTLGLSSNILSGTIPEPLIAALTNAPQLDMSRNQFSGSMPSSLSLLTKLTNLNLSFNRLADSTISSISTLTSLQTLSLSNNLLTGSIPAGVLAQMTGLQKLDLSYNQLSGTVPVGITVLGAITSIDLSNNDLSGWLPTSISEITTLKALNLNGNEFTGSIPSQYSNLNNLVALKLCCNKISGTLPNILGGLLKLETLDLSNNRLHGTIPTQYTGLVRLTLLNLRNNQLTGPILQPIPASLTSYNLDLNYFSSGFSSPPDCNQGSISFRFNCLQTPADGYACQTPATASAADAAVQRPEVLCAAFCGISADHPPCGGHGSCYAAGPNRVPTCDCDSGFVNGELPGSCVAEGTAQGDPMDLVPTAAQIAAKGHAAVASNGRITLTDSQPNMWGAAFFQLPVSLFSFSLKAGACGRPFAFTVYFSFSILKPATANAAAETGDGFAFVIASSDTATGGSSGSSDGSGGGGSLGYAGMDEHSIAVEFDTSKSTDANDPDNNHVGFSVRGNTSSIATAKAPFTLNDGNPKHAWIVFDPSPSSSSASSSTSRASSNAGGTGSLQVFLSANVSPQPSKAVLSVQVSLCHYLKPTKQDSSFLMGFSASASDSPQQHSILAWTINAGLPEPTTLTGQQFGFRFNEASLSPVGANLYFRYASGGVQPLETTTGGAGAGGGGDEEEVWVVGQAFSWADLGLPWPVKNQGACGDCWAYAVVGSIEMAYGILSNLSVVPLLSVIQLRDALGSSCSQGNSPSQAFQYLITLNAKANIGLMEDGKGGVVVSGGGGKKKGSTSASSASPLCGIPIFAQLVKSFGISCGRSRSPGSSKPSGGPFRVSGFERTAFHGWFGLLLAVQRQPVVVHVQATAPSFLNYDGLSKYADPSCFTYNLNHVVLLVGYRLTGSDPTFPHMAPPFWIIRNSWGPEWGDGGHMRMDIQGGDGVCGINTLPGIYPVVRAANDPCNVNGTTREEFGSLFNPCGNFTCTPDGSSNRCDCNDPRFVEARNPDNTRTCAYKDACRAAVHNPCAVGTCVNDGKGSYSCVCPPGFRQGTTVDGTFSCAPGDSSSKYTVVLEGLTCADIHPVYGLTLAQLQAQNPGLSCSAPLAVGTVVNVVQPDNLTPCSVYYTTSEGDTCESLAAYFSLMAGCPNPFQPCAEAFQALNPGLDCSSSSGELVGSQAVCVERRAESAAALLIPMCSQFYLVQAGETCDQIRSVPSPPLSPLEFFRLNPGIKCSRLVPKTDVGSLTGFEACIGSSFSFMQGVCPKTRAYVVGTGDRCTGLQVKYFRGIKGCYRKTNGYDCIDKLVKSTRVCIPDQVKIKAGKCEP